MTFGLLRHKIEPELCKGREHIVSVAAMRAQESVTPADAWSFEYRNGIICKTEVLPPEREKNLNWSLANLYSQEDAENDPAFAERLGKVLADRNIKRAYGPSVIFHSGHIVEREELTTEITLPGGAKLFRRKDLPADGVPIRRGEAFVMSGAGCPPVIIAGKGFCLPMHGSRDTLVDRASLAGNPPREHSSVIHAGVAFLKEKYGVDVRHLALCGGFHIRPSEFTHPFNHPKYGETNARLFEHLLFTYGANIMNNEGDLDMAELALGIARDIGIPYAEFGDPLPKRAATTRDGREEFWRNLVLVYRTQ